MASYNLSQLIKVALPQHKGPINPAWRKKAQRRTIRIRNHPRFRDCASRKIRPKPLPSQDQGGSPQLSGAPKAPPVPRSPQREQCNQGPLLQTPLRNTAPPSDILAPFAFYLFFFFLFPPRNLALYCRQRKDGLRYPFVLEFVEYTICINLLPHEAKLTPPPSSGSSFRRLNRHAQRLFDESPMHASQS